MALFDPQLPSATADVVRITLPGGGLLQQRFSGARPIKATVAESAKLMTHPIENGEVITDHRIILPVAISLAVILRSFDYRSTYAAIREAFRATQQFSIQTKTTTYTNMYLRDIPHEEDPTRFDTVTMILEFIEAQFFNVQVQALAESDVVNNSDSSTVNRGEQSNQDGGSVASNLFDRFNRRN